MANANKCPTCRKHFASDKALQQHTGATNQKGRKKHRCGKCDETFYSEQAMEQHRESPIHDAILSNTMLECAPCDRWFGSKTALTQHERSGLHAKVVAEKAQHEEPEVKEEDRDENEDEDVEENKEEEGDEADWEDIEDEDSETSGDPDDSDDTNILVRGYSGGGYSGLYQQDPVIDGYGSDSDYPPGFWLTHEPPPRIW